MTLEQAKERIEELEERVRQLEHEIGANSVWHLNGSSISGHGRTILGVMITHQRVTRELLMGCMYRDRIDGGPEFGSRILDVTMHKLRRRLKKYQIKIQTVRDFGYEMDDRSHQRLRALTGKRRND